MIFKCNLFVVALLLVGTATACPNKRCCEKQLNVSQRRVQNKRYHVVDDIQTNFFTAVEYCRKIGMDLASIENQAQQNALWNYITSLGLASEHFWISGSDLGHEGNFVWLSTGRPLIYKNFMANQPDNTGRTENCLELRESGKWNDLNCYVRHSFVCQF